MTASDLPQLFATDKEIFDLIMSSPKRMSSGVLFELIADRRIFCSMHVGREDLAGFLSSLAHDYHDLTGLIEKGEHGRRAERTTSLELQTELTTDELRAAVVAYQHDMRTTERVATPLSTPGRVRVNVEYEEIDYSRTRLIQRQRREADIDFTIKDGKTLIRLPATDKARRIVAELRNRIESSRKTEIAHDEITIGHMTQAKQRTDFFMKLAANIKGFKFEMATDAKVARFPSDTTADEADDDDLKETEKDALSVINSISIRGVNIIVTQEYQKLLEQNFFLTAITWRSVQESAPRDQVQFEAAFEDGVEGTGFRYSVRHRQRRDDGKLAAAFQAVPENRRPGLFQLIEESARQAVDAVSPKPSPEDQAKGGGAS